MLGHLLSHSNSFGFEMEKDAAGCRAFNRNFIVGGSIMNRERLGQIRLPAPEDFDPHPRLLLNGRGIHAGETFRALFPDGWREITLEMSQKPEGPGCWYISNPGFTHICPIGLFVKE